MWIEQNPKVLTKSGTSPKVFISAPFGNYIKPKGTIPVTGTFTLNPRGNRLWSVLSSLRYSFKSNGGWTNKLGLPNPGIEKGLHRHFTAGGEVLSIAEIQKGDFNKLVEIIPERTDIELNLSCPNLAKRLPWDSARVFTQTNDCRKWCIAKLSPLTTPEELEFVIEELGFEQLHFSNTLPTPAGGLSGPTLKPYTLELIDIVRERWGERVEIIAGGGVRDFGAVSDYLSAGANHVSLGSVCFNPFRLRKLLKSLELKNV